MCDACMWEGGRLVREARRWGHEALLGRSDWRVSAVVHSLLLAHTPRDAARTDAVCAAACRTKPLSCSCPLPPPPQEFNELIGLEAKIATEERLVVNQEGNKLVVKVRAPFKAAM
jgi:hypothetical protein